MDNVMSGPEVAKHLGVSERRVRAMIAGGQLPAQRMMGRWVIPADAVSAYRSKIVGRPMAERSAWSVMQHLADEEPKAALPPRLRNRIKALGDARLARQRLRSWVSARGKPVRVWAFKPALDRLQEDDRVVVSGDHFVPQLEPSGQLRVYANAADVDDLIADYGLRRVNGDRLPNAIVWAVSDLDAVPRNPDNEHAAAEVVAAMDLLDEGDPRAVGIAEGIIERALDGHT
ncbi:MAG: helix-turn-helix domain-containing protein [Mycobacterium sp.]